MRYQERGVRAVRDSLARYPGRVVGWIRLTLRPCQGVQRLDMDSSPILYSLRHRRVMMDNISYHNTFWPNIAGFMQVLEERLLSLIVLDSAPEAELFYRNIERTDNAVVPDQDGRSMGYRTSPEAIS